MMDKKNALVTGGSSAMGLAISRKLKQMGLEVVIFDIQSPPDGFQYFKVDIRSDMEIKQALSQIPHIDVLVNNAGVYFEKYLEDTTNDEIDKKVFLIRVRLNAVQIAFPSEELDSQTMLRIWWLFL
ncbi:MAG: SDR family NAD(P)-dependent oxidoreductase [Butyricicoccus pullicaecorum]|nr:SDR family NAD(P)-dependent oxidoreductase [Butyricicoccus pullicaecorum]